nr:integrase, catalytic region, zinc finger, CCHC-type, peptidase aspartic, catalytic [Tanacetum cinerariifolium]
MTSLKDVSDPTKVMNTALILFAKAFQLIEPTNNNQRTSSNPRNCQIAQPVINMSQDRQNQNVEGNGGNQFGQYAGQVAQARNGLVVVPRIANQSGTGNIVAARAEGIQLQAEEFDFMATTCDLDEIEEVNANCILMANLQHTSTSGTQLDKAPVYDTDVSAEVQLNDNCYDNEIFNMFSQEEQYTDLLEPISEPQLVPQNDNHVTFVVPSMVQSGDQKMALGYPSPSYLKKAQPKQQSLYDGNLLLEEHDPPAVYDSEETLELAQESREQMRFLKKEIKPANYAKINHLSRVFVPQTTKSKEELFLSNVSNMVTISKMISIPNEDLSDDTTPSVARKFLNEVKNSLVTLKHVVKQKMTVEIHNWSSSAHKEVYKIISHEIAPIINQVDARVQNFEIQFLQEAAKFVRDFKSLTKEADESLDKVDMVHYKQSSASIMTNPITDFQRHVTFKENVSSDMVNASSTGLVHTARTKRPQPKGTNKKTVSKFNCVSWQVVQICLWCVDSGCPKHMTGNIKLLINFVWMFLGTIRFGNDHIAAILGYGDLKWGNITITRVYFIEGLCHNLFSVGQFCDADLEVAFRMNSCFIRDLDGVDLLKGNRSSNLYTINLYDMTSASPICLMAHATPTKSWLWHQRLSHLNFDTINNLAKNDLVSGLPKFKYAKEYICPSCEQGKSKRASHLPKLVLNSKQRLHLLHMDLCGPIVGITHETSSAKTPQQNGVVEHRNRTLVEAARTMLIFSNAPLFLKPDISYLYVFGALCYPKNDREDIGKLGAKGDIGFFIGYSTNSITYRVYNQRTKKIMEMMNVTIDELSAMAFEQNSSKPGLQSLTFGQISFELELTYALSTITPQRPSKRDLDILFEPLHNEYLGGRRSEAPRTIPAALVLQNLQALTASMSIQDSAPAPANSLNTPVSSHNVDAPSQQHAQQ